MSVTKSITVRLDPEDYERLVERAKQLGVSPGTLGRVYVRAGLTGSMESEADRRRRIGLEALDRLAAIREELGRLGYPAVDAVELVREGREDLERRLDL